MDTIDQYYLEQRKIDTNSTYNVTQQAMRIALYDEYRAKAFYENVVENFGEISPFSNILKAEERHIKHLELLFAKYDIELFRDSIDTQEDISVDMRQNCTAALKAEIENVKMYEELLQYVKEEDVREVFFRLQACSYNEHIPALQRCIAQIEEKQYKKEDGEGFIEVMQKMLGKFQDGRVHPEDIQNSLYSLLSKVKGEFVIGAFIGGVVALLLGKSLMKKEKKS